MRVKYTSNNSGGSWWLKDQDWFNLEKAGWIVDWVSKDDLFGKNPPHESLDGKFTWLGAIAKEATLECETPTDAMRSFEKATGQDVSDEGCNCCGAPHSFSWGRAVDSENKNAEWGYVSGEDCLSHLYGDDAPKTLREAIERRK